ncbi:thioredoxin [Candidatus Roizmanbacteria bacterium]|jgi:thioredoxin 1|nr:thioredoxin [Candidatus Roizmanbacteria bacterium]
MSVAHISQNDFQKEVVDHKGIVFVDFYAEWCGPCKMTGPIIDELATEMQTIKFVKVNVDENSDLASQYSIFSIPTVIIFKDGKPVNQFVGAMGKEGFKQEISKATSI